MPGGSAADFGANVFQVQINVCESFFSDTILMGCTDAMQLSSLVLSLPAVACRFTAPFSATDVEDFLLP
jgi:hypothetical protein